VRPLVSAVRGGAKPADAASPSLAAAAGGSAAGGVAASYDGADDENAPIDLTARLRSHLARVSPHEPTDVSELVRNEAEHSAEVVRRWLKSS